MRHQNSFPNEPRHVDEIMFLYCYMGSFSTKDIFTIQCFLFKLWFSYCLSCISDRNMMYLLLLTRKWKQLYVNFRFVFAAS